MIALADAYRIFDNNKHCILCLGDAACAIMTLTNGTYYMYESHSINVIGFQNNKGSAVLLYYKAQERLLANLQS